MEYCSISQIRDKVLFNTSHLGAVINILSVINDKKFYFRPEIAVLLNNLNEIENELTDVLKALTVLEEREEA